jgi:lysophospholipase L1-like esterase
MSDNINFDYKNLSPFKWFVLENFPFIEADFDALTEWQLFCKIGKEINKIIDSQNIVGEQAETLTNAFNELQNYVNNYFDNLDVQEEINNKLNEMAQSGELDQIVGKYITRDIQPQIDNIKNEITEIKNREIIIVGDSYLAGQSLENPNTENYGYLLMQKMKFTTDKFHLWAEGGSSFVTAGNQNHTWQTLLQSKLNTITPNNITDIFFIGGYNDVTANSPQVIENAMKNCINYAHSVLPNAKVFVCLIANNASTLQEQINNRNLVKNRIYNVYKDCTKYNAIFIPKGQLPLQDYTLFENNPTAVHPNKQGHINLANWLYELIEYGDSDFTLIHNAVNGTLPQTIGTGEFIFREEIRNNNVYFYPYGNILLTNPITNKRRRY